MTNQEKQTIQYLIQHGFKYLIRRENGQLYTESDTRTVLLDSSLFKNVLTKIPLDILLTVEDNIIEIPTQYQQVLYKEKEVIKYKIKNNIPKEKLEEWLFLLKEGYRAELRRQIEEEINNFEG